MMNSVVHVEMPHADRSHMGPVNGVSLGLGVGEIPSRSRATVTPRRTGRTEATGRLVVQMNVTLDGCVDHTQVIADEEHHQCATALLNQADAILFGRLTYQLMNPFWPDLAASGAGPEAMVDFARKLDAKPKYVVSRTLPGVTWQHTTLLRSPEAVVRLKAEGRSLLVSGGPGLGSTLANMRLVDEYHIFLQPFISGHGPRLLEGIHTRQSLKLVESRTLGSGVVALHYVAR